MLNEFKLKTAYKKIAKLTENQSRKVVAKNFDDIRTVGIIYDATTFEATEAVKNYANKLRNDGLDVQTLGYVNKKELENFHIQPMPNYFFSQKDLNWHYMPIDSFSNDFANNSFDLLINLDTQNNIPVIYVLALSKAGFKTGLYSEANAKYLDMMINMEIAETQDVWVLLDQIFHYMTAIKTKQVENDEQ